MSKFTFIKQPEDDNWMEEGDSKLTTEFNAVSLDRLLEEFELFLKGSGFVFDGHLEFVQHKSWTETYEDDLDNIEQFFGKAKETAKKLDEGEIVESDVFAKSPKTPEPWPFKNSYID